MIMPAQYCDDQGRTFLALPGTTQGSTGLEDWWTLLDDVWFRARPLHTQTHMRNTTEAALLATPVETSRPLLPDCDPTLRGGGVGLGVWG